MHRDLKREPVLHQRDDGTQRIKILDFGIAKYVAQNAQSAKQTASVGTPLFMAPEQIRGDGAIGPAADNYALSHIAYALLTGSAYWSTEAAELDGVYPLLVKVMEGVAHSAVVRAAERGVSLPLSFDAWFERATSLAPDDRPASASLVVESLAECFGLPAPRLSMPTGPTSPRAGVPSAHDAETIQSSPLGVSPAASSGPTPTPISTPTPATGRQPHHRGRDREAPPPPRLARSRRVARGTRPVVARSGRGAPRALARRANQAAAEHALGQRGGGPATSRPASTAGIGVPHRRPSTRRRRPPPAAAAAPAQQRRGAALGRAVQTPGTAPATSPPSRPRSRGLQPTSAHRGRAGAHQPHRDRNVLMTRARTLHRCLRAGIAAALLVATASAPSDARAQTTPDATTAALAVFRRAQELVAQQKFAEACPLFEEVVRIEPRAIGARLQLADCYERTGRVASAWTAYSVAGDAARRGEPDRASVAREKVEALRPKVPELTISVGAEAQTVVGLEVKRNGVLVGNAQWGMPVPVDPGAYIVSASGAGKKPWTMTIRLEAGEKGTLEVPGLAAEPMVPSCRQRCIRRAGRDAATAETRLAVAMDRGRAGVALAGAAAIFAIDGATTTAPGRSGQCNGERLPAAGDRRPHDGASATWC